MGKVLIMVVYFRRIRYSEQVSLALPQAPRKKVEKGIFVGIIALFKMNYAWYFSQSEKEKYFESIIR